MNINKSKIALGIGAIALTSAISFGAGFSLNNYIDQREKMIVEERESESQVVATAFPFETKITYYDNFIIPEVIENAENGTYTLKIPVGYELYCAKFNNGGIITVDRSDPDYVFYNGFDATMIEGYIGIKPELKYLISASKSLNANLTHGNIEILNAKQLEIKNGKVIIPFGYSLYDLDNDEEKKMELSKLEAKVNSEGTEYTLTDESVLNRVITLPSEYAKLLECTREIEKEAEDFYNGYKAKSIG